MDSGPKNTSAAGPRNISNRDILEKYQYQRSSIGWTDHRIIIHLTITILKIPNGVRSTLGLGCSYRLVFRIRCLCLCRFLHVSAVLQCKTPQSFEIYLDKCPDFLSLLRPATFRPSQLSQESITMLSLVPPKEYRYNS